LPTFILFLTTQTVSFLSQDSDVSSSYSFDCLLLLTLIIVSCL